MTNRRWPRLLILALCSGAWVTLLASFLWVPTMQLVFDGVLMIGLLPLLLFTENMQTVRDPLLWWSGAAAGFLITWAVWFGVFVILMALIRRRSRPMSSGSLLADADDGHEPR